MSTRYIQITIFLYLYVYRVYQNYNFFTVMSTGYVKITIFFCEVGGNSNALPKHFSINFQCRQASPWRGRFESRPVWELYPVVIISDFPESQHKPGDLPSAPGIEVRQSQTWCGHHTQLV